MKEDDEIIELSCNCPYADAGNNCKHMAAVLFYLVDKDKSLVVEDMEISIEQLVEEADVVIIANNCLDIWQEILYKASIELKRKIYNWFTGHLDGSVIDYMEDII